MEDEGGMIINDNFEQYSKQPSAIMVRDGGILMNVKFEHDRKHASPRDLSA